MYLRSSFTPCFDDAVQDLFEARPPSSEPAAARGLAELRDPNPTQTFGEDGKLVVYYAMTPAWG